MDFSKEDNDRLVELSKKVRNILTHIICKAGGGHLGGTLSLVEIIVSLYFWVMKINPVDPKWGERDRFILSKGHAGPILYVVLALKGFFPKDWLLTINKNGTNLPSHIDKHKTPGVDVTAGSLGQGISVAVGSALASKLNNQDQYIFCIIGDGESQEGQVWEAAMFAAQKKLDNLIVFTDYNKLQIDDFTSEVINLDPLIDKWKSFGWEVFEINGHDFNEIIGTINTAKNSKGKPSMIIANTIKGKGNEVIEGKVESHFVMVPDEESYKKYINGLEYKNSNLELYDGNN